MASPALSNWKRQNPPKAPGFDWEMYRYVPSLVGAIMCLIVFLIMAGLHLWQFVKTRNRIVLFVVVGALCKPFLPSNLYINRVNGINTDGCNR
jgi:hypothetical protein